MPGGSRALVVGGGIDGVAPLVIDQFLFLSNILPPEASTSPRLIRRATSIEILGDGPTSTAIGANADANGTNHIALGNNVITLAGTSKVIVIGENITIPAGSANQEIYIGSATFTGVATGSDSIVIGFDAAIQTTAPSSSVCIGHGLAIQGNNVVLVGHSADALGSNCVAIGANTVARANCVVVGPGASAGADHQLWVGHSANGSGSQNLLGIGNRQGAAGTMTSGDILLGHQDNANNIFSLVLWLGGGPDHKAATAVPDFTIKGRQASGSNLAAGNIILLGNRGTGTGAPGGFVFQTTAPTGSGSGQQAFTTRLTIARADQGITMAAPTASGVTLTIGGFGGAGVASLRLDNLTDGAGVAVGTLNNAPAAGDPAVWVPINIGGTVRHFPGW